MDYMDNIIVSKIWEDETIFELQIEVYSQYVKAYLEQLNSYKTKIPQILINKGFAGIFF